MQDWFVFALPRSVLVQKTRIIFSSIRIKPKTNRDSFTHVFPRSKRLASFYPEFLLAPYGSLLSSDWLKPTVTHLPTISRASNGWQVLP